MPNIKRALKRLGLGLLILIALALIANVVGSWWVGRQLNQRIARLRADGAPTSIRELAPPPVPADQDGAALLAEIAGEVQALQNELQRIDRLGDEVPAADRTAQMREQFAAYDRLFPMIHEASLRPQYRSPMDYSLPYETFLDQSLEHQPPPRVFARVLRARAQVLLAEGRRDEALQASLDLLRLCRAWDQEPMIVGYLVSLSCRGYAFEMINRILRDGPISPVLRAALNTELYLHDETASIRRALTTERAFGLDAFRSMSSGWAGELFMWHLKRSAIAYIEYLDRAIAVSGTSHFEMKWEEVELSERDDNVPFVQLLWPAVQAMSNATDRTRALARCLLILNATQVFQEKTAIESPQLADLDLPKQTTIDPYSGKPLHLKMTDKGWLIYSVGSDSIDDGGATEDAKDVGIGPVEEKTES